MTPDDRISEAAVHAATGHGWDHWMALLDARAELDHAAMAKWLQDEATDVSFWWVQTLVVEWERRRGKRVVGQAKGGFQVSVSRTVRMTSKAAFKQVVSRPFLPGATWREGATWTNEDIHFEVRRVTPGKALRWFQSDARGRSTVVIDFWPNASGEKVQVRITHSGLPDADARTQARARWRDALDVILA